MGLYSLAPDRSKVLQSFETMIVCIIESGADLHEASHHNTPLIVLLAYSTHVRRIRSKESAKTRPRDLRSILQAWLKILRAAGVDLIAYGAQESRIFRIFRSLVDPRPQLQLWYDLDPWWFSNEVFHFTITYGPTPEDWTVQLDMAEQYAGDFWRMPDLSDGSDLQAIPGSWIDT